MLLRVVRVCAVSVTITLVSAAALGAQSSTANAAQTAGQQNARVIFLLAQLADQARQSGDLAFAVRAQSEAATLLWPYDCEQARAIYRRAFESLANVSSTRQSTEPRLKETDRRQLRAELLNDIASRDSELAEEMARMIADVAEGFELECEASLTGCDDAGGVAVDGEPSLAATARRGDGERRELLISVALQIVERDPHRAMALGQLSLAAGVSEHLAQLLTLMRTVDARLADLLFSNAVDRLERSEQVALNDIHTLGSYLVTAANSQTKEAISRGLVGRFLNLAYDRISKMRRGDMASSDAASVKADESAALYFIGRQLGDLFARYLPDRLSQLQRKIADLSYSSAAVRVIDPAPARATAPTDIAREAREARDAGERDSLYARAAMAWLAKGETSEAQAAASKIADFEMRDRVLSQIARRHASAGQLEDAVAVARRIEDRLASAGMLVSLASAALASKDRVRAAELLNEAEACAVKARPSIERAQVLLKIVSLFSAFDLVRGFEVMQAAVKTMNQIPAEREADDSRLPLAGRGAGEFHSGELDEANFESTLAALGRADFDRALLLAQQLTAKEASVLAQLAVCRGGLASEPAGEQSTGEDELEMMANH
jgi:hypothetical protein